ncbi:sensor histidine kinase [Ruania halotolerans]|uniref:sensor histidine kinase n=1 Tax=Ruania halotolerans TaxID=2897773 RepID=UPI001E5477D2|nr:HAMP domain-containing sensor histidine kinase [Ruania halotolerans]UFU06309.1 HAMP domain-containing histidine kinase [Ruania halotolerans]
MIPAADLAIILAVALGCALVAGLLGVLVLRLTRRARMLVRLLVVAVTGIVSLVAAVVVIAWAMYFSEHDLAVLLWVAAAASLSSVAVALVLGRVFGRDSDRVAQLAQALGDGVPVRATIDPRDRSELTRLTAQLADTSDRLDQAREEVAALDASRRELVAWISHDLRTPLAGLRAMAEALVDGMADDPERFHRQVRSQVDHLSGMVDELFELSKIQSGTLRLERVEVALYDLVSDAVADLRVLATSRKVRLQERGGEGVVVMGDPRELTRVVENLLANAVQHSPAGGEVVVDTTRDHDGNAVLTVRDSGGGIAHEDLTRVFEAGWRGTSSRTPARPVGRTTGAGLGLAIVRGIVEAHAGRVSVENVDGGACFRVFLPRVAAVAE